MKATPLRHRLKFFRQSATRSATGAVKVGQWEHALTVWGQFTPLSVNDAIQAQAANTNVTARLTIRHRTDITHAMRIQHAGKMYDIVGEPLADATSGREYLTLMLKAVT